MDYVVRLRAKIAAFPLLHSTSKILLAYSILHGALCLRWTENALIEHCQLKASIFAAAVPALQTSRARSKVGNRTGVGGIRTVTDSTRDRFSTA